MLQLRPAQVAVFEKWVRDGAVYPGGTTAAAPPNPLSAEARQFWSFQPLRRHPAPAVKDAAWARRPIDSFLLATMEARGLSPSATADRRTLIRRVTALLDDGIRRFPDDPEMWFKFGDVHYHFTRFAFPSQSTLRTARGARCWSRSVEPLPEECGTPTSAISQLAGSSSNLHLK